LRRYLEQEGFFGARRVALVDIGWNGTIQYALREAFGEERDFPDTMGLYLSFNDGFRYDFALEEAKGVLYDSRISHTDHNVFALFEELFENSARAFHGTTVGYQETAAGRVEPELRSDETHDRRAEREFDACAKELRQGILDFADAFVNAMRLTGYGFEDIKPVLLARAARCVVYPSKEETSHLLEIVHTEDLGTDGVMSFKEYRLPGPVILFRPMRLLHLLRTSNWKYGTARTLGLPGTNYILRRFELAVARRRRKAAGVRAARPRFSEQVLLALVRRGGFPILNRLRKLLSKQQR
jgi:hypothetical protein